jgi:diguanylate cyclase (GGDEF)-like protein/PAS domain S-box-containing protein
MTPTPRSRLKFLDKALFRNNGIARRIMLALILFSSVITAVITAAELYIDYRADIRGIDERIESIRKVYLPSLTESVWVAENAQIQTQLDGLLNLADIEFMEVRVDGATKWSAGARKSQHQIEQVIPLLRMHRGQNVDIGELHIVASVDNVMSRIWSKLIVMLVSNAIKTLLVTAFVLLIFQAMVGQHLEHIAAYLRLLGKKRPDQIDLHLNRPATGRWRPDALDHVTNAINQMQHDLSRSNAELRIAASAFESQEGMIVTDANKVILRVNQAFTETTGYTADEAIGQTPRLLQSGRHDAAFYRSMWESIHKTGVWRGEIWDKRKDGEVYPKWLTISALKGDDGAVTHYIGTHYDISERKRSEAKIHALAFFDQLTGLPNRTLLMDRLKQAVTASSRSGSYGALLFIDLDNFKMLNDTLGHGVGDLLLQQVAHRLTLCVREGDTVARLGGDEFVVIVSELSTNEEDAANAIESVSEKMLASFNESYQLGDVSHHSTASIGVTLFKGDEVNLDDLMKQADLAMYKSKEAGRNVVRFFAPTLESAVKERAALEGDLRQAVAQNQFLLHYQAQVVGKDRVTGAEVLVRWQHPLRGIVSPAEFIPLAEETGLILPLGRWVLETACAQLAVWGRRPAMSHLTVAVNVSAHQFRAKDFVEQVLTTLRNSGANPHRLKLELTESLLIEDVEEIIEKMFALKAKGVGFSLDDFGTGFSSLSYLKRMPLDQLKIDKSFVDDVLTDPNDAAIARTVVALAQSLGLSVIAEGVETEAQRDFLVTVGCHAYQGYLFSRPLTVDVFEELFHRG